MKASNSLEIDSLEGLALVTDGASFGVLDQSSGRLVSNAP